MPTFAEALEAFAASKPAPTDLSAAAKWYEENLDVCLKAREPHPNITYREMYAVAQQSGLPPEVTRQPFQSTVSVALTNKRSQRRREEQWQHMQGELGEQRPFYAPRDPFPATIQVEPNSAAERALRKMNPELDAAIAKARGEAGE